MDAMIHHLPTADVPWQDVPFNGRYDGSAPFGTMLAIADVLDARPIQLAMHGVRFHSLPVYAAYMGAGWADVYAGRFAR